MNHRTMKTENITAMITGATGGIGEAMATELADRGATVILVARDPIKLVELQNRLLNRSNVNEKQIHYIAADLLQQAERDRLVTVLEQRQYPLNLLINNAGSSHFGLIESISSEQIDQLLALNTNVPIHLTQLLLPILKRQTQSQIINVGSTFGSIGYPGFATYCASKYALRGFTEALSRELSDSTVKVKYLSPRATQTPLNSAAVVQLNQATGVSMDPPQKVAAQLLKLITTDIDTITIGWPEKLFVKLNQLCPFLLGKAIIKDLPIIRRYAQQSAIRPHQN